MELKDMTNEQIVRAHQDGVVKACTPFANYGDSIKGPRDELLRRLNEADALRKENEKLRKDKERIDFLDDGNYGIDPRNIPGVMMNGRRFHCLAGRGDWSSLRDAIDAARLAKESEASHDRSGEATND